MVATNGLSPSATTQENLLKGGYLTSTLATSPNRSTATARMRRLMLRLRPPLPKESLDSTFLAGKILPAPTTVIKKNDPKETAWQKRRLVGREELRGRHASWRRLRAVVALPRR